MQKRDAVVGALVKHRNALHAFILASVRDPDLAEDVLQDISVSICASSANYDPDQPFLPWARTVARNRIRDLLRKDGRHKEVLSPELVEEAVAQASDGDAPRAWSRKLEDCIHKLGARARQAVELRYV